MDLPVTLGLLALFVGFGMFAGWRGARPPDPFKGPRMVPWRFLMLLATAGAVLMVVHLANLGGLKTGR